MRYLITGGAGFIGSHLARKIIEQGRIQGHVEAEVTVLDDLSTGRTTNIIDLESKAGFKFIYGNVLDKDLVDQCVKEADQVFHLASAVGVKLIIDEPVKTIETIVGGTTSVLEACARYRRPVLITSTSEVYGKSSDLPFSEDGDSVIGPPKFRRWAYAAAKSVDEFLALAYWHQMQLPVIVVRLFNTVGPRQTGQYGMVVPRFVQQALANDPITIYGDGTQRRCFCHVYDVVDALNNLMSNGEWGNLYNIGSNEEISIEALAHKIISMTSSASTLKHISYSEAYGEGFEDMARRIPDLSKVEKAVNYSPIRDLNIIIEDVVRDLEA